MFLNNILIYSAFHHSSSESSYYFQNVGVHYFSKWKKPNELVKVVYAGHLKPNQKSCFIRKNTSFGTHNKDNGAVSFSLLRLHPLFNAIPDFPHLCFIPLIFISLSAFFHSGTFSCKWEEVLCQTSTTPLAVLQKPLQGLSLLHCLQITVTWQSWSWGPSVTMVTADLCEHTHLHCYSCHLLSHVFPLVTQFLVLGTWNAKSLGWELPKIMNIRCKIGVELCEKYVEQ